MPKKIDQMELEAVLQAVSLFSDGASVDEIGSVPEISLPRRTLQRRLALYCSLLFAAIAVPGMERNMALNYRVTQG